MEYNRLSRPRLFLYIIIIIIIVTFVIITVVLGKFIIISFFFMPTESLQKSFLIANVFD